MLPRPDFEAMLERHPHIALSLSRTLSARLQRLQQKEQAPPALAESQSSTRTASALVFEREGSDLKGPSLWDQVQDWFTYLSTGAKIRLAIVVLLFFWLMGVVAPWLVVQRLEGGSMEMRHTQEYVMVLVRPMG